MLVLEVFVLLFCSRNPLSMGCDWFFLLSFSFSFILLRLNSRTENLPHFYFCTWCSSIFFCIYSVCHLVLHVHLSSCGLFEPLLLLLLFFIFKAVSSGVLGYFTSVLNPRSFHCSPSILGLHVGNEHILSPTILMCYFQDLNSSNFFSLLLVFSLGFSLCY